MRPTRDENNRAMMHKENGNWMVSGEGCICVASWGNLFEYIDDLKTIASDEQKLLLDKFEKKIRESGYTGVIG